MLLPLDAQNQGHLDSSSKTLAKRWEISPSELQPPGQLEGASVRLAGHSGWSGNFQGEVQGGSGWQDRRERARFPSSPRGGALGPRTGTGDSPAQWRPGPGAAASLRGIAALAARPWSRRAAGALGRRKGEVGSCSGAPGRRRAGGDAGARRLRATPILPQDQLIYLRG
jgi:hypothetical protein